jgi:DNA repair ATPase RecN
LELLEKEKNLKTSRDKSIEFLDNITRNIDSKKEQEQMEKSIVNILQNKGMNLQNLEKELGNKKEEERKLEEGIKTKSAELERIEKRLEQLTSVKPAHFQEMQQLEQELSSVYKVYVEKLRNHDFLSHQLEIYMKIVFYFNIGRSTKHSIQE